MIEIIFDLETKSFFTDTGNFDPAGLGVSIVSVYRRRLNSALQETEGEMVSFWETDMPDMWKLFRDANRIVGFNSLGFDVPALKPYAPSDFAKLPHFDILDSIRKLNDGRGAGLNAIARDTLGLAKVDDPANAIKYWQAGDPASLALLQKYCEADVLLTRDVYDFGLKNKFLKFTDRWNNPRQVPVDFSYPADAPTDTQPSLF